MGKPMTPEQMQKVAEAIANGNLIYQVHSWVEPGKMFFVDAPKPELDTQFSYHNPFQLLQHKHNPMLVADSLDTINKWIDELNKHMPIAFNLNPLTLDNENDSGPLTERDFQIIERLVPQDQIPGKIISSALHWFEN